MGDTLIVYTHRWCVLPTLSLQVKVPIVFRGPNGAAAGVAAQHSQDFSSWYSHCPGLKVREDTLVRFLLRSPTQQPYLLPAHPTPRAV